MNSLREEIQETLYNLETDFGNATITNEILKLFEKRIDELMNPYINMDNKLPYYHGCLETLQKVKELLK